MTESQSMVNTIPRDFVCSLRDWELCEVPNREIPGETKKLSITDGNVMIVTYLAMAKLIQSCQFNNAQLYIPSSNAGDGIKV